MTFIGDGLTMASHPKSVNPRPTAHGQAES
jgi:hypothetical protein